MKKVPWNDADRKILKEAVDAARKGEGGKIASSDFQRIAQLFPDRSRSSLHHEIFRLRGRKIIEHRKYVPWTDEEVIRLREIYGGTAWRIAAKKNFPERDPREVREKARQLGLNRRFLKTEAKELNDGERGLMAGLLMADGCLSHRLGGHGGKQHMNTIEFSNTDEELVSLFASMASNCRVRSYETKSGFQLIRKKHYACSIGSREAVRHTLMQILPYLVGAKLRTAREMMLCLDGGHK